MGYAGDMVLALVAGLVLAVIAAILVAVPAARAAPSASTATTTRAPSAATSRRPLEAAARATAIETAARADALELRTAASDAFEREVAAVERRAEQLARAEGELALRRDVIEQREEQLDAVQRELQARRDRAGGLERDARKQVEAVRSELETRAGVRGSELIASLSQAWLEDARARAAAALRAIDQTAADPAHDREAKRVMEIAATRYHHHYLTERAMNHLRVGPQIVGILLDNNAALHGALERVSGLQLLVNDEKDAIRLDGLDGVGKEMVRRAMGKLIKKPESIEDARKDPEAWSARAREHLNQEIRALGKRAFQVLGIQKAHPEIVELVGALNFRTSYTQNQWWHAVESSYLAGMMAAELGLDEKLARRATLMHDIGKALTHKIEGSHAVIGADIARRLGEPELVANAIVQSRRRPCNSVYAYLSPRPSYERALPCGESSRKASPQRSRTSSGSACSGAASCTPMPCMAVASFACTSASARSTMSAWSSCRRRSPSRSPTR